MNNIFLLDYFASPYQIKFMNTLRNPTVLGLILSLSVFFIGLALFIKQGTSILYKEKPRVNRNKIYDSIPLNLVLDSPEWTMFSYYFTANSDLIMDKRYFSSFLKKYKSVVK